MEDRRLAVHRAIVVVDVEGFGDQRRTNPHQVAVRDDLYRAMQDAFGSAGSRGITAITRTAASGCSSWSLPKGAKSIAGGIAAARAGDGATRA
jgi:hypothetical protein